MAKVENFNGVSLERTAAPFLDKNQHIPIKRLFLMEPTVLLCKAQERPCKRSLIDRLSDSLGSVQGAVCYMLCYDQEVFSS